MGSQRARYPALYLFQVLPFFACLRGDCFKVPYFFFSPSLYVFCSPMVIPPKVCSLPGLAVDGLIKGCDGNGEPDASAMPATKAKQQGIR